METESSLFGAIGPVISMNIEDSHAYNFRDQVRSKFNQSTNTNADYQKERESLLNKSQQGWNKMLSKFNDQVGLRATSLLAFNHHTHAVIRSEPKKKKKKKSESLTIQMRKLAPSDTVTRDKQMQEKMEILRR